MKPETKQNKCKFCGARIPLSVYCCPWCWERFEKAHQEEVKEKNRESKSK